MTKLVLHPTDLAQWYALVNEAEVKTRRILDGHTESYLVFLLMRFTRGPRLLDSILALDFLESLRRTPREKLVLLQEVGDKSLLVCSFFKGLAEKRHVPLHYFSNIGQTAYYEVSSLQTSQDSAFFARLSTEFMDLQTVLQAIPHRSIV